jgi:stress response protein YsnF
MQTVVGVFDTVDDAEMARNELVRAGFDESSVQVQSHADESSYQSSTGGQTRSADGEGFMASVSHFFKDLFGGEDEHAGHYSEHVRRGGSVVAVTVSDESKVEAARSALAAAGAVDIDKRTEGWREEGYSSYDPTAKPYKAAEVQAERDRVVPVVREELEVGKRQVDLGAVRVFSRMESRPVNETVELREERADIQRRPVDRPATEADLKAFEGGAIEVHEMAERAVVNKSARVVEEVVVGTHVDTRQQTISDNVRNTVVEVQRGDAGTGGTSAGRIGAGMESGSMGQERSAGYRTHFENNLAANGGRYEEYEPAYAYGSQLRSDSRYANRSWDDVEADASQNWSTQHPGSTWEKAKAAVKHGWESMTGGSTGSSSRSTSSTGTGMGSTTGSSGTSTDFGTR